MEKLWTPTLALACCIASFGVFAASARAEGPHRALIVSDIHFDPFAPGSHPSELAAARRKDWKGLLAAAHRRPPSTYGHDTNAALLGSALGAMARQAPDVDLLIVPGDVIAHDFERQAGRALGVARSSPAVRRFVAETALFVLGALRAAAPGRPIVVGFGNNDSECGDYSLEPGGPFLARLRDTVRALAGPSLLHDDFDITFPEGGYYRMRHPTVQGLDIVVVNDVLWSTDYRDRCGSRGAQAADAMLAWLGRTLAENRSAGRRTWLVHHIPLGIDGFGSLHGKGATCAARVTPLLRAPFATRFAELVRDNGSGIELMISGHLHHDTYRLVRSGGDVAAVDKVAPGISPIYGNNPGFEILTFDPSGRPLDLDTWSLPLDAPPEGQASWRLEYRFTQAYAQQAFSKAAMAAVADDLLSSRPSSEPARRTFAERYPVGHGAIGSASFRAHACAVSAIDPDAYAACACLP